MGKPARIIITLGLLLALLGAGYLYMQKSNEPAPGVVTLGDVGVTAPEKTAADGTVTTGGTTGGTRESKPEEGGTLPNPDDTGVVVPGLEESEQGIDNGGDATIGDAVGEYIESENPSAITPAVPNPGPVVPLPDPALSPPAGSTPSVRTGPISLPGRSNSAPAAAESGSVGAGSYTGGSDMSVGVWNAAPGCEYTLNGASSPLQIGGSSLVEIRSGDSFSSGCSWKAGYPASKTTVTHGWHVVGKDMPAGNWQPAAGDCAFSLMVDMRGSNFLSGSENMTSTQELVTLKAGDIFYSNDVCASWKKV